MEARYREIIVQRVKDKWYNWTESEKKARNDKAQYDAAMRELEAHDMGVEEHLNQLESRGGTI
jgi:hypothetical protein